MNSNKLNIILIPISKRFNSYIKLPKMPRRKTKPSKVTSNDEDTNESSEVESVKSIKTEEPRSIFSQSDLSKYMYQKRIKKPHIKIEFESSPDKKQGGLWEPPNWKDFLVNLRIMRANNDAPVDSMGCESSADRNATPEVYRYQCLISLMLSSQTKDQVTFAAMERLRARGLTVDNILAMSDEELGNLIYPVGYWKTKVKYIKKTTQTLKDQYGGDIPDSVDKLCELTGVGPKMAHICMKTAWNKITGIGVDTHVHRISNRIGWVKKPTSTPEDTRKALESWLPFELWSEVNHLMVGFGQTICSPLRPTCHECLNRDICPTGLSNEKTPTKSPKKSPNKALLEINSDTTVKKSPKAKKVTPKKELLEVEDEMNNFGDKIEKIEKKSPVKRKTTPKKAELETQVQQFTKTTRSRKDTKVKQETDSNTEVKVKRTRQSKPK